MGAGPPVHVIATFPADGAGLDCGTAPDCGVAPDAAIELRFDRYLHPTTAVRQSLALYSNGANVDRLFLQPTYDVLERVVSYQPVDAASLAPVALDPGVLYTLEFVDTSSDGGFGFRAFDGAPIAFDGAVGRTLSFRTRSDGVALPALGDPRFCALDAAHTCSCDIPSATSCTCAGEFCRPLAKFALQERCRGGQCHGGDVLVGGALTARMGFSVDDDKLYLAIGRPAHQTLVGAEDTTPLVDSPRFGVRMPLIDPGRPDNSYVLYKLLRSELNYEGACAPGHRVGLEPGGPAACLPGPGAEGDRLREWFVRGEAMPFAGERGAFSRVDIQRLQEWIRAGAPLEP